MTIIKIFLINQVHLFEIIMRETWKKREHIVLQRWVEQSTLLNTPETIQDIIEGCIYLYVTLWTVKVVDMAVILKWYSGVSLIHALTHHDPPPPKRSSLLTTSLRSFSNLRKRPHGDNNATQYMPPTRIHHHKATNNAQNSTKPK